VLPPVADASGSVRPVSLTIGEFARRLRVTVRTVRHYEQLGLLRPKSVDARNGYRSYGSDELLRGLQIAQLKSTGLDLATIGAVIDGRLDLEAALRGHRRRAETVIARKRFELATTEMLLAARGGLPAPALVDVPAEHAVVMRTSTTADALGRTIRRSIQQIGRAARCEHGTRCRSFSARFPLDLGSGPIEIAVAGIIDGPTSWSSVLPAETRLSVPWVGPVGQLPLAYDLLLGEVREQGLRPLGTAVEHYLDLAEAGRTEIGIPIQLPARARIT
jgi:DNA-binding transcriptional MerR regulator